MRTSEQKSIFVYGSFTEGLIHNIKIEQYAEKREAAYVFGHMYLMNVGYPVMLLDNPKTQGRTAQKLYGELITLQAPDLAHKILDDFHGVVFSNPEKGLYFKDNITAYTESGEREAIVYHLNPKKLCKSARYIDGGHWKQAFERAPKLQDQLSKVQIEYMRQLASIKGRETHRYNLDLCRQLMKLELVVDKGRRFALTRLGKDILRYTPDEQ